MDIHYIQSVGKYLEVQAERTTVCTPTRASGPQSQMVHRCVDLRPTCTCGFIVHQHNRPTCISLMILPQVHLRKPCYDFYFL